MGTMITQKTYMAKAGENEEKCYLIDAADKVLGKVATKAATILRGKHKPTYTPHIDSGDMVVIINAEKIAVSGNKRQAKEYQRYTGYHGGRKTMRLEKMLERAPAQILRLAIERMIPSGSLGNKIKTKLKIYAGTEHPHAAQKPVALEIK